MRTLALILLVLAGAALAQTRDKGGKGGNIRCTIDSVTPVSFGSYDTASDVARHSTGSLRFTCTPGKTMTIQVAIGPSAMTGSVTDRAMRELGGGDLLHYNLFQDQRGSVLWGDGINGGTPASITGHKDYHAEIYGIARPHQQVSEGTYVDVLRITVLP
jgi:spore coat protein U-like protein